MSYFYNKFTNDALNKAYELLENVTPLPYDCGSLCSNRCCMGSDHDGMILFPGENIYFENREGYSVYRDENYSMSAVNCHGKCDRQTRPLACRIFPYMFYVTDDPMKKVTVAPDIRAPAMCDILKYNIETDRDFMRKMRMTAKVLAQDPEMYEFIRKLTELLTDFGDLG